MSVDRKSLKNRFSIDLKSFSKSNKAGKGFFKAALEGGGKFASKAISKPKPKPKPGGKK